MGYLPSKNFIAIVGSALVVIFVGWFLIQTRNAPDKGELAAQNTAQQSETSFLDAYKDANRDSDNDGLKDWEEILWKTNINNPDTDSDGTSDGEEIKEGRDPTIAGHKLADSSWSDEQKKIENTVNKTSTTTPETVTDRIAKEFAAQYLSTQGSSAGALDDFQKQNLADSLVQSISRDALLYKDQFTGNDVKIVSGASQADAKNYLNATGGFLEKTFMGMEKSEADIVNEILSVKAYDELKQLDTYIAAYQKTVDFLKKESVPENYAKAHLELMNIMQNTKIAVAFMRIIDKDPAGGLMGLYIFQKQVLRVPDFFKTVVGQIQKDGLDLKASDGGYYFIKNNP